MLKKTRPKVIAALKEGSTADDCKKIAKRLKVKLSYVQYVRKQFAKEVGYKKRKPRVVRLDVGALDGPKTKRRSNGKPVRRRHGTMRARATEVLRTHGESLPAAERAFYSAALELVLKGD